MARDPMATDEEEYRFLKALTSEHDPLWWEVALNSLSRDTYTAVARNLQDRGLIYVHPDTKKFALTDAGRALL